MRAPRRIAHLIPTAAKLAALYMSNQLPRLQSVEIDTSSKDPHCAESRKATGLSSTNRSFLSQLSRIPATTAPKYKAYVQDASTRIILNQTIVAIALGVNPDNICEVKTDRAGSIDIDFTPSFSDHKSIRKAVKAFNKNGIDCVYLQKYTKGPQLFILNTSRDDFCAYLVSLHIGSDTSDDDQTNRPSCGM